MWSLAALIATLPDDAELLFCGDLINRGPSSAATLDLMMQLGPRARFVLGNHDLHFLATATGARKIGESDTFQDLLSSPKRDLYVEWLRQQPLALVQEVPLKAPHLLVHAGILPDWSIETAMALADEVSQQLRGDRWQTLLLEMYGNQPVRWSNDLAGYSRLRLIINVLTRTRLLHANGDLELRFNGGLRDKPAGTFAWFDYPSRRSASDVVMFGHWSALGLVLRPNIIALDTGCVWGNKLTAVELSTREVVQVDCLDKS
jgi:bis(5'-nucleosyl)-tetraphosphatase (symmetrical)